MKCFMLKIKILNLENLKIYLIKLLVLQFISHNTLRLMIDNIQIIIYYQISNYLYSK